MLICLHIACACFLATKTEQLVVTEDHMAYEAENIYYLAISEKAF